MHSHSSSTTIGALPSIAWHWPIVSTCLRINSLLIWVSTSALGSPCRRTSPPSKQRTRWGAFYSSRNTDHVTNAAFARTTSQTRALSRSPLVATSSTQDVLDYGQPARGGGDAPSAGPTCSRTTTGRATKTMRPSSSSGNAPSPNYSRR